MILGLTAVILLCLGAVLFLRNVFWSWIFEWLILLSVALVFWQINVYLSVCVLVFHSLSMIQLFKTQNLLGLVTTPSSIKQKIQSVCLVSVIAAAIAIEWIKNGFPEPAPSQEISTVSLVSLANGEMFPYVIALCLLSALLMFGLVSERRRR